MFRASILRNASRGNITSLARPGFRCMSADTGFSSASSTTSATTTTTPTPTPLTPTPTLLLKLRADLKDAMRSKNQAKLDALRTLLSNITNSLKSSTPPTSNSHIHTHIQKQLQQSRASISDFQSAGRADLVAKEQSQVDVLSAYADSVERFSPEEISGVINEVVGVERGKSEGGGKVQLGPVMRMVSRVLEEGGKAWVKGEVAAEVKRVVEGRS